MCKYRSLELISSKSMESMHYMKTSLLIHIVQCLLDICIVTSQAIDIKLHLEYMVLADQNLKARRQKPVAAFHFVCIGR